MSQAPPLQVLIVGIDKWLWGDMPPLKGAVNDAKLMKRVLQDSFAVPDKNITTLINEDATRENIINAFRTRLIDRAKAWIDSGTDDPSPAFVFLYAGHGSRCTDPTGTQPDGKDETIVPYDSRVGDVYDIKDWEIAGWLNELTSYTDNVTVIMDCCHSGSGTRSRDEENQRTDVKRYKQGAFTWYLAKELSNLLPGQQITYYDLFERTRLRVNRKYRTQMPQCEGDRDRVLFGGARVTRNPLVTITQTGKNGIWIDAGAIHGVS